MRRGDPDDLALARMIQADLVDVPGLAELTVDQGIAYGFRVARLARAAGWTPPPPPPPPAR